MTPQRDPTDKERELMGLFLSMLLLLPVIFIFGLINALSDRMGGY